MKDSVRIQKDNGVCSDSIVCSFSALFQSSTLPEKKGNQKRFPSILTVDLLSMSHYVSVVAESHRKRLSKSRMQFFVDDLVVGLAMLSISILEMERLSPSANAAIVNKPQTSGKYGVYR